MELEFGAVTKRLETENLKLFQFEQLLLLGSRSRSAGILLAVVTAQPTVGIDLLTN
jgi:hypothetical protein